MHPEIVDICTRRALVPTSSPMGLPTSGWSRFVMSATKVGTALPIPYFGNFPETNVRLYSIDDAGRHGVLFRSLETARLAVVPVTRIGRGVRYTWGEDADVAA